MQQQKDDSNFTNINLTKMSRKKRLKLTKIKWLIGSDLNKFLQKMKTKSKSCAEINTKYV